MRETMKYHGSHKNDVGKARGVKTFVSKDNIYLKRLNPCFKWIRDVGSIELFNYLIYCC